jgi:hypothetical protein
LRNARLASLRGGQVEERKKFFLRKNQKLLSVWRRHKVAKEVVMLQVMDESFLVLFLKKELLPFLASAILLLTAPVCAAGMRIGLGACAVPL